MVARIVSKSDNLEADHGLERLLATPDGFDKLASDILPEYIRETRDYESFARKVLFLHPITEADTHPVNDEPYVYYNKDFSSHAAFYADDGEIAQTLVKGTGVDVGIFTIASDNDTINKKTLMTQKFNYIERIRELAGQNIGLAEDTRLLGLVNKLITDNKASQEITTTGTELTKADLVKLLGTLRQHDLSPEAVVLNPLRLNDILNWGDAQLDELSQREIIQTGVRYTLFGVKLIPSRAVPVNEAYVFAGPEFVGRMPVLKDVTCELTETATKLEKGLFLYEFIGMYVASHKAIGKLVFSNIQANPAAVGHAQLSVTGK